MGHFPELYLTTMMQPDATFKQRKLATFDIPIEIATKLYETSHPRYFQGFLHSTYLYFRQPKATPFLGEIRHGDRRPNDAKLELKALKQKEQDQGVLLHISTRVYVKHVIYIYIIYNIYIIYI